MKQIGPIPQMYAAFLLLMGGIAIGVALAGMLSSLHQASIPKPTPAVSTSPTPYEDCRVRGSVMFCRALPVVQESP